MIKNSQLKELIQKGFDLESISFELGIPIERLKRIKQTLSATAKAKVDNKKATIDSQKTPKRKRTSKPKNHTLRIEELKRKYDMLYYGTTRSEVRNTTAISKAEEKIIKSVMVTIQKISAEIELQSKLERRNNANIILNQLKQIEDYPLTIEQAKKILSVLMSNKLEKLKTYKTDRIDSLMTTQKVKIVRKLIEAINWEVYQTEEIEKLKRLEKELTPEISRINKLGVECVKSKIINKIIALKTKMSIDKMQNQVPAPIESIVKSIAKGTLDVEKANKIINNEAKKRVQSKPKTRFSLTEEQEKNQIIMQIKSLLSKKASSYFIEDPETSIKQIQELSNEGLESALRLVIENLIGTKDFERAKEVLEGFINQKKEPSFLKTISLLKKQVRNAQISDIILKGINEEASREEQEACLELIKYTLKKTNIQLKDISLGKSQDGSRTILLSDICQEENEKTMQM